jgi:hypothetical protein
MNLTSEQKARVDIGAALVAAGWILENRGAINLAGGPGVAVREAKMASQEGLSQSSRAVLIYPDLAMMVQSCVSHHGETALSPERLATGLGDAAA